MINPSEFDSFVSVLRSRCESADEADAKIIMDIISSLAGALCAEETGMLIVQEIGWRRIYDHVRNKMAAVHAKRLAECQQQPKDVRP